MSEPESFKRWYERQPKLSQAVKLLIILPDEVRTIIGEALMLLANREFEMSKYSEGSRSLGGDKVLGLYKSKNRRREYDQNETLHQAMNYLYILSDENQDFMAVHILKMLDYMQQYFATCREFNTEPSLEDVAALMQQYVIQGSVEVERFLKRLRDELYKMLLNNQDPSAAPPSTVVTPSDTTTKDNSEGMRVTKLDVN